MAYTEKFKKASLNQYWLWLEQNKVRASLSKSLADYKTDKIGIQVDNIIKKHSGNGSVEQDLKYAYFVCEKVSSLMICEKENIFYGAEKLFLRLAKVFPQKMMEEMDRVELFTGGLAPPRDYPFLYLEYDSFKNHFEEVGAVKKIIIVQTEKLINKEERRGKRGTKKKYDLPSVAEIENFLATAFAELKDWNEKNPGKRHKFNEAFLISTSIIDSANAQIRFRIGMGKFRRSYYLYRKLLGEKYEEKEEEISFFKFLVKNFVTDKNLRKEMQDSFNIGPINRSEYFAIKFEHICHEYIKERKNSKFAGNINTFACKPDKMQKIEREERQMEQKIGRKEGQIRQKKEPYWTYLAVIRNLKSEFKKIGTKKQKEHKSDWFAYTVSKIKDPALKEQMEMETQSISKHAFSEKSWKQAFLRGKKSLKKKDTQSQIMDLKQKKPCLQNKACQAKKRI